MRALCLIITLLCLPACAHTKPLGQTLVAAGALIVGVGVLDAAGVMGSKCSIVTTPQGDSAESCSGNSVVPQSANILGIALGAGLIAGGAWLWTNDAQTTTPRQAQSTAHLQPLEHAGVNGAAMGFFATTRP